MSPVRRNVLTCRLMLPVEDPWDREEVLAKLDVLRGKMPAADQWDWSPGHRFVIDETGATPTCWVELRRVR